MAIGQKGMAMGAWLAGEASLEELLGDEIMGPVVASAGMTREAFRLSLAELARRLACQGRRRQSGQAARSVAVGC